MLVTWARDKKMRKKLAQSTLLKKPTKGNKKSEVSDRSIGKKNPRKGGPNKRTKQARGHENVSGLEHPCHKETRRANRGPDF